MASDKAIKSKAKDCRACPGIEYEESPLLFGIYNPRYYACSRKSGDRFLSLHHEKLADIYAKCRLRERIEAVKPTIAGQIVDEIRTINILFNNITNIQNLFSEDIQVVSQLHIRCRSREDYWMKIGSLALLFEREVKSLRKLVKNPASSWKSIKLIEVWLQQSDVPYDLEMIQIWKNIKELRNATFPYHSGDARILNTLQFFDQGFPPDYKKLWDSILERFLESLRKFRANLLGMKV